MRKVLLFLGMVLGVVGLFVWVQRSANATSDFDLDGAFDDLA